MSTPPSGRGPVGVGLIGAGMISDTYLENLTRFPDVTVVTVGDLDPARARAQADKHGVAHAGSSDDVLAHPEVELVVNLTIPAVHAQVSSAAIAAGKHVWSEKPIAVDRASARALLQDASRAGLIVGTAPDTILGPGVQTALRAIARGDIGTPLSAQTTFQYPGPDMFHPNPEFLFAAGAGPLFDVGPYYLTTLALVFGSFESVAAVGSRSRTSRTVLVGEKAGTEFPVVAPTHVAMVATFAGGGIGQSLLSFDSPLARVGIVEITGTEGTLMIPDPNYFGGLVKLTRPVTIERLSDNPDWIDLPVPEATFGRGVGALDMARCIRSGGTPLASGELGYHVLDTMVAIEESVETGERVRVTSRIAPVPLLADDWDPHTSTVQA